MVLLLMPVVLCAQGEEKAETWEPFRAFVGEWDGHETGRAGIGKGDREYSFVLQDKYLHTKNTSTFEPQEKNPEGEVHGDWSFVSFDQGRQKFVLREFHTEGFVIQYTLDSTMADNKTFMFVSESVENAPPGMKARLTIVFKDGDHFTEVFELAFPGKDFVEFLRNEWTRRK